jgi:hypothetical protein
LADASGKYARMLTGELTTGDGTCCADVGIGTWPPGLGSFALAGDTGASAAMDWALKASKVFMPVAVFLGSRGGAARREPCSP